MSAELQRHPSQPYWFASAIAVSSVIHIMLDCAIVQAHISAYLISFVEWNVSVSEGIWESGWVSKRLCTSLCCCINCFCIWLMLAAMSFTFQCSKDSHALTVMRAEQLNHLPASYLILHRASSVRVCCTSHYLLWPCRLRESSINGHIGFYSEHDYNSKGIVYVLSVLHIALTSTLLGWTGTLTSH